MIATSYTPRELAKKLRVSPDRIRAMIRSGELPAVNMAKVKCGKPRFVILSDTLRGFLEKRSAADPVKKRAKPVTSSRDEIDELFE